MWRFFRPHAAFPPLNLKALKPTRRLTNQPKYTRCEHSIGALRG